MEKGKIFELVEDKILEMKKVDENSIVFVLRKKNAYQELTQEDINNFEKDIKDLGKWRVFRELKKDLEDKG